MAAFWAELMVRMNPALICVVETLHGNPDAPSANFVVQSASHAPAVRERTLVEFEAAKAPTCYVRWPPGCRNIFTMDLTVSGRAFMMGLGRAYPEGLGLPFAEKVPGAQAARSRRLSTRGTQFEADRLRHRARELLRRAAVHVRDDVVVRPHVVSLVHPPEVIEAERQGFG
jgi:hypothetical protein